MHIVISGSSPDVSNLYLILAREAQPGRAELWRCLGCKFKSYLEQVYYILKVVMELVDMNSLGLFDFYEFYPFKSDLPYKKINFFLYNIYICCRLIGKS